MVDNICTTTVGIIFIQFLLRDPQNKLVKRVMQYYRYYNIKIDAVLCVGCKMQNV